MDLSGTRQELRRFTHAALLDPAPSQTAVSPQARRRRRVVCAISAVVGALVLHWSLSIEPGSRLFYPATLLLAAIWFVGGRASGPVEIGHARRGDGSEAGHGVAQSLLLGAVLLVLFLLGAVVVARIPVLSGPVQGLLDHARRGSLPMVALITAINGVSEEYFFRGALMPALGRRWQVAGSTLIYTAVTACAGIPLLALAGAMLGVVVGLQRRATGGWFAPTITHLTWSLGMLFCLPLVLDAGQRLLG